MIVVQIFCGLLWTLMVRWSTVIYLHLFLFKTKLPWNHFELWWVWSSLFVVIVPLLVVLILVNAQLRGSFALFLLFAVDFAHGAGCVTFKNPAALQFSGVTLVNTFPAASCNWSKLHRFLNQFFLCFLLLHFSSNLLCFHPMITLILILVWLVCRCSIWVELYEAPAVLNTELRAIKDKWNQFRNKMFLRLQWR